MGHWFQRNPSWCTSYRIHCIAWILNFLRIPDSFREKTALKFWKPKKKQNRIRCLNDIEYKDWQAGWRLCLFLGRPSGAVFSRIKLGLFFVLWVVSVNNFLVWKFSDSESALYSQCWKWVQDAVESTRGFSWCTHISEDSCEDFKNTIAFRFPSCTNQVFVPIAGFGIQLSK
jgi:hypothetical protein